MILYPEERSEDPLEFECSCSDRGDYFEQIIVKEGTSGHQRHLDYDNYVFTKFDQEHFY